MPRVYGIAVLALILTAASLSWGERRPAPKIEILQPKAGQALGGMVDARLKLPAPLSGPVYAGLGGPPWAKLERASDANEWRALLDSKMVPNGPQKLIVKTYDKRADLAFDVTVNDPNPGDTIARIELFEDGTVVQTDEPNANRRRWTIQRTPEAGKHYYFVKVTQADGNLLWSAPVWLTVGKE
jgi:hypothetical protein